MPFLYKMFKVEAVKHKMIIFETIPAFVQSGVRKFKQVICEYLCRFLSCMNEIMTDVNQIFSQVFPV